MNYLLLLTGTGFEDAMSTAEHCVFPSAGLSRRQIGTRGRLHRLVSRSYQHRTSRAVLLLLRYVTVPVHNRRACRYIPPMQPICPNALSVHQPPDCCPLFLDNNTHTYLDIPGTRVA